MPAFEYLAIFAAGFVASGINSVAGGGTLLSFPVLLWAGRDPVTANATNTLALWPGSLASAFAFRREVACVPRLVGLLSPPAIAGGLLGGALLLHTPAPLFRGLVPYLVLLATLLLAAQRPLVRLLQLDAQRPAGGKHAAGLVTAQFLVSVYGGYFGAGMGIIMLAALGLYGLSDIHQRNGLKNVLSTLINGVAGLYFVISGAINWTDALLLMSGAIAGGYGGGAVARRLRPSTVQGIVIGIGVIATLTLILKRHP